MPNRKALTMVGAVTASLISGAIAVGATVGRTPLTSLAAADAAPTPTASPAPATAAASPSTASDPVAPGAPQRTDIPTSPAAALWFAGLAAQSPSAAPTSGGAAGAPAAPTTKPSSGARGTPSTSPAPVVQTPPPTAAPGATTTTTGPLYNCSGSDDGLTESYKHAREVWCEAHGGIHG